MGFSTLLPGGGPTQMLGSTGSTSVGAGSWFRVHPRADKITFQFTHTGTSVGATVQSTCFIQGSNDGVNPLETTAGSSVEAIGTVVFSGGSPQSAGVTLDRNWAYVRVKVNSLSTGSIAVTANAHQG